MENPGVSLVASAKKNVQASLRRDPNPRRIDRARDDGRIENADPERVYVWAYKVGDAIGSYEARGYDIERKRPGGPRSNVERKSVTDGAPVEWKGNVLMSCPKEIADDDYEAGQAEVDQLEARIISKGGGVDTLRGIQDIRGRSGAPTLGFENKTSAPQVELE